MRKVREGFARMTWMGLLKKRLRKDLDFGGGMVEHTTKNGWEMLCSHWTLANDELLLKFVRYIIDLDKKDKNYHYYITIGCTFPVTTGPHLKRRHYYSVHRYPKDSAKHEAKKMARLMRGINNADD